jgi:carotenoid cleavage dioxygenase-like enzyme
MGKITYNSRITYEICTLFQLIKVDIKTHKKMTWCEENVYPSEPIFVPSPEGKVSHHICAVIAACFYNFHFI